MALSRPLLAASATFASLRMPRKAFGIGITAVLAPAAVFIYLKLAHASPINVTWLYYSDFFIVYSLLVGPILLFAAYALKRPEPFRPHQPRTRFLCIVPAHNEQAVIQNPVRSLLSQRYPKELYDVYVVAHECTDRTEEAALALGAKVLRVGGVGRTKAHALAAAFRQLLEEEDERYVCVIDADNGIEANFLEELNNAICAGGYRCLQVAHDVLNGSMNWLTKAQWVGCISTSRLYNLGRWRSLGNSLVGGTGWCCQATLLKEYWPLIRTQTEDIELSGLLLLHEGVGVQWLGTTRIYDEKTDSLWHAIRQRQRWMTGHMRVAGLLFWPCLREGIHRRDLRLIELAAYYLVPFALNVWVLHLLVQVGIQLGIFTISGPLAVPTWERAFITWLTAFYIFGYPVVGFGIATGRWSQAASYSINAAVFAILAWAPALIWAWFGLFREDWIFHTPHVATTEVPASPSFSRVIPAAEVSATLPLP